MPLSKPERRSIREAEHRVPSVKAAWEQVIFVECNDMNKATGNFDQIFIGSEFPLPLGAIIEFNDEGKTRGMVMRSVPYPEYLVWCQRLFPGILPDEMWDCASEVSCD